MLNTRQDPWKAVEQRLTVSLHYSVLQWTLIRCYRLLIKKTELTPSKVEEATASVTIGPLGDGVSMKDSDTEE